MYSENVHVFLKCEKLKGSIQSQLIRACATAVEKEKQKEDWKEIG
uniref:Uncharacterized protein n=1 Tax=Anguilla anguilla TaxID=7936 RepID=A0A0E9Q1M5_ANGAN